MRSAVLLPLAAIGGALGLLLGAVWLFQRRMIYFPTGSPTEVPPEAREVVLRTADGLHLAAWLVPTRDPRLDVTVLVANGNGGHRGDRLDLARGLAAAGMSVLLFDYRGYGGNPGKPSERGLALDVRAARKFLVGELGVRPERLLYLGESLGCAVVTELATEYPAGGLLLRSPFESLAAVAGRHYPFLPTRALLRDRFPVLEHIGGVGIPTVVVYGDADEIVPAEQSRSVAVAAPLLLEEVVVPGARHNDPLLVAGPALIGAARALLR